MQPKTQSSTSVPVLPTSPISYKVGDNVIYTNSKGHKIKAVIIATGSSGGMMIETVGSGKRITTSADKLSPSRARKSSKGASSALMFAIGDKVEYLGRHFTVTGVNNTGIIPVYELDNIVLASHGITKIEKKAEWHDGVPEVLRDPSTWIPSHLQCTCGESFVSGEADLSKHSTWCDLIPGNHRK